MRGLAFFLIALILAGCSKNDLAKTVEGKTFYTRKGTEFTTKIEKNSLKFFVESSRQETWNIPGLLYFDGSLTEDGGARGKSFAPGEDKVVDMKMYVRDDIVYQEFALDRDRGRVVVWPWGSTDKASLKYFNPYEYLDGDGTFQNPVRLETRSKTFAARLFMDGNQVSSYFQIHGFYEFNTYRATDAFFTNDGLPTGFLVMTEDENGDFTAHAFFDEDWIKALPQTELKLNHGSTKNLLKDSPGVEEVFDGFFHALLPLDQRIVNNHFEGVVFGQIGGEKSFYALLD